MEVILQQDYPSLGFVGDRVNVKGGFARNFLIPRKIAVELSSSSAAGLKHKLAQLEAIRAKKKKEAEELKEKISTAKLEFKLKVGEAGKSFGSIGSKDIEQSLRLQGFSVERRQIRLLEAIRNPGSYKVEVRLHSEVVAVLALEITGIIKEVKEEAPAEGEAVSKGKRSRGKRGAKKEATAEGAEESAAATAEAAEAKEAAPESK